MLVTPEYPKASLVQVPVRLTERGGGFVLRGRVTRAGDTVELPPWHAGSLVRQGEAEYTCKVRVLMDSLSIGARTCAVGEVVPCAPDRAQRLREDGLVEIVTFGEENHS